MRPNNCKTAANYAHLLLALALPLPVLLTVNCAESQQPVQSAEKQFQAHNQMNKTTTLNRDVSDLHLTPDFRAVKLKWSYGHNNSNEPAAFSIRYCELTSWNIEIKCRGKELQVEPHQHHQRQQLEHANYDESQQEGGSIQGSKDDLSVIIKTTKSAQIDTIQQLDSPQGPHYEAKIYDLRALTNYTFHVHVARFSHEPIGPQLVAKSSFDYNNIKTTGGSNNSRGQAARRLSTEGKHENRLFDEGDDTRHSAVSRIETKPFSAEATKCLADVSELIVNTGKYFGGRISVEGSSDPRCTLIGNKSSEQTTYLFRIEHDICGSKTVDGKRIESMVLVHENKDILTHNTARFLVLCNFLQKSFTLRASVSLPKVNGLLAPGSSSRPAVITSLPGKPPQQFEAANFANSLPQGEVNISSDQAPTSMVLLGSMPGIYRARTASQQQLQPQRERQSGGDDAVRHLQADLSSSSRVAVQRGVDANRTKQSPDQLDKLDVENNTIEQSSAKLTSSGGRNSLVLQRQPKDLEGSEFSSRSSSRSRDSFSHHSNAAAGLNARARSLTLSPDEASGNRFAALQPPAPVQVQSKMLFVERSGSSRNGRQHNRLVGQQVSGVNLVVRSSQIATALAESPPAAKSLTVAMAATPTPAPTTKAPVTTTTTESTRTTTTTTAAAAADTARAAQIEGRDSRTMKSSGDTPAKLEREDPSSLDSLVASIIMTNNHRVSGDYLPMAQAKSLSDNNYSIKYSAVDVGEYTLGAQKAETTQTGIGDELLANGRVPLIELQQGRQPRGRSGRMRSVDVQDQIAASESLSMVAQTTAPSITADDLLARSFNHTNKQPIEQQQQRQLGWSISERMGDLAGETTESSATNSTITGDSAAMRKQFGLATVGSISNSSLAHNITNYLLKWSLKTLSNLARKSLETLIENDYVSSTEPFAVNSGSEPPPQTTSQDQSSPVESVAALVVKTRPSESSESPIVVMSSSGSITPTTMNETRSLRPPELAVPTRPMLGQRPSEEPLLDGFITSAHSQWNLRPDDKGTTGSLNIANNTLSNSSSRNGSGRQPPRPSNYSKSLDFSEGKMTQLRPASSSAGSELKSKSNTLAKQNPVQGGSDRDKNRTLQRSEMSVLNGSTTSGRDASYLTWLLYGLAMLVVLITGLFLILWLVSAPSFLSQSNRRPQSECGGSNTNRDSRANPIACFDDSISPVAAFGLQPSDIVKSARSRNSMIHDDDVSYQKYDYNKFENCSGGANNGSYNNVNINDCTGSNRNHVSNNLLLATNNKVMRPNQQQKEQQQSAQSSARSSSSSSSASANSTNTILMADEHDCRNSELLYNEHVLVNTTESNFGESYA